MSTLMRIDLFGKSFTSEEIGAYPDYKGFGGRGFTSKVVFAEVPPTCHPLGENNKLVIAPGLLSGSSAANSGRLSIGAKSPLTGGIKESNVGGNVSFKLARLGIRGLILDGKVPPGELVYIVVGKDGVVFHDALRFKGMKNYELVEKLKADFGERAGILSIGPAGEMMMGSASVACTDTNGHPSRHAGRGGMGAVMGSKGVKAIVVDDNGAAGVEYSDKEAFRAAAATFRDALRSHDVTKPEGALYTYGTNVLTNIINEAGAYPTRNFTSGRFEGAEKISGERMTEIIKERGGRHYHSGCTTCIIQCSNVYLNKNKEYVTSALEYETIWAHGAHCGIDDLDAIAEMDRLCDDYGLDTIETGCALGVAMAGGIKSFGDAEGAIELIHEIGKGSPLGRILGNGAAVTGRLLGVEDTAVVKGQGLPAYDPRAIKGNGVTYATSTMGADHTAGYCVATNILRCGGYVDPLSKDGQVDLSRNLQIATAALDSAGLCVFVAFAILDIKEGLEAIPRMLNARFGWNMTLDDVAKHGQEILKVERAFNDAAGFTKIDDRLPEFFKKKKLPPHNTVFDISDEDLDTVFNF
ncbi:MAG: aldehyde ferredoxin oxidoreductase [Deltaproteobacteria bacterium]|nr:aldehyde ferredoxin oxidoreductase [Deltaproteobacteria bacterium]